MTHIGKQRAFYATIRQAGLLLQRFEFQEVLRIYFTALDKP